MHELSKQRTRALLEAAEGAEIAVIGDVMLDRYFWGAVTRVSPEAPVPVVDVESETYHLGGAANVAANLSALGTKPFLYGVVGDDASGRMLQRVATDAGLDASCITVSAERPTTVKTRVFGNNQQIVRLDREHRNDVAAHDIDALMHALEQRSNLKGIVLADYNKGLLSAALIERVLHHAQSKGIKTFVDPKHNNFFSYKQAFVVKPNRKEAQDVLGYLIVTDDDVRRAGRELLERLMCENVLLTLGASGMMLFEAGDGSVSSVTTRAQAVADVSGAGDTTIATLAVMIAGGASMREAAALANAAAGVVVEVPGIVPITPEALLNVLPNED